MPTALLPSSAAAFAPRSDTEVVCDANIEDWLAETLQHVKRSRRPLKNVGRYMVNLLSSPTAIWTLCSTIYPKAPDLELRKDENLVMEAHSYWRMFHIEAYVVHIDMVFQKEVAFKLTPETIEALVVFHKDIYSVDIAASTSDWTGKDAQLKESREAFVQAINKFVYRTSVQALEGLEEGGAGELFGKQSEGAKIAISNLFIPFIPPPPQEVHVLRSPSLLNMIELAPRWQQPCSDPRHRFVVATGMHPSNESSDGCPNLWDATEGLTC